MGEIRNTRSDSGPNVVCLEGNGQRPSHMGDGWKECETMYTLNGTEVHAVCYGIGAYWSKGMLSDNPKAGFYEADTTRALDLNGGNPSCNQGGICVVEIHKP